jgi:hypothetical protein
MLQNRQPGCNMAKARVATSPKSKSLSHKSHKNPQKYKLITSIHPLGMNHPSFCVPLCFLWLSFPSPVADLAKRLDVFSTQDCHILSSNLQSTIANLQCLQPIQRTLHAARAELAHMRIDHGG